LKRHNQVACSDIVVDIDGKVRRGLLSVLDPREGIKFSLGTRLALEYLKTEGMIPEQKGNVVHLGQARFISLRRDDGGYAWADDHGFKILLNFRAPLSQIQQVSLSDLLTIPLDPDLFRDRIVLIGSKAESFNEFFGTPYREDRPGTSGVFVHAVITSQILSSALDGRAVILTLPKPLEWLWSFAWASVGMWLSWQTRRSPKWNQPFSYNPVTLGFFLAIPSLPVISYLIFWTSAYWIPVLVPLLSLLITGLVTYLMQNHRLQQFAYFDALTRLANRRYFDHQLVEDIAHSATISLILCDVDCFKLYNDTYGHQAGDFCLQQLAIAISAAVRQTDLVARYGGEEFAIILPNSNPELVIQVAERVLNQVRNLRLSHRSSLVKDYVTLSCGVAMIRNHGHFAEGNGWSPSDLISQADRALYVSKMKGRDCLTAAWELPPE
jgi:diguanylate cyclase (GGDEF)-like protein